MFIVGLSLISILIVTQSINEIIVFIIALVFSIILLSKKDINKNIGKIFLIIGSVTNFMDLLTAPIITLGLPLIITILLYQKNEESIKTMILKMIKYCIIWGLGYAFTWGIKLILTQLIFDRQIISQALEQARYRSSLSNTGLNYIDVLKRIFKFVSSNIVIAFIIICAVYVIGKLIVIFFRKKQINIKQNLIKTIPYFITGLLPFVWLFVVQQHSYIHAFFVYRIIVVAFISIFIILDKITEVQENNDTVKYIETKKGET